MEGAQFDAPGGKRDKQIEENQAAAAIEAKQRAAARRREQAKKNPGQKEPPKSKPTFGGKAGFGTPAEDDGGDAKEKSKSASKSQAIRKEMRDRERQKRDAAAAAAGKAGKPPDLRAAELIQQRWRERQVRLGKRSSAKARPKAGVKADGSKSNAKKTPEEIEQERAAARIQAAKRGADARKATSGKKGGVASSMTFLDSEASRKAEAEEALARASSTIARFYMRFARKRAGRKWIAEEGRRRHEAAAKVQAARRGQRIRRHIGYRGHTEGEFGRPHGVGRMVWPDGSSYTGEWIEGVMEGDGEMVWHDGSWFDGSWSEGKRHGRGVYEDARGTVHEGEWSKGVFHGEGKLTLLNGSTMEGRFEGGVLNGRGVQVQRNEDGTEWFDEYDGDWASGERSGSGIERCREGQYEGMWRHGRRHGVGKFVDAHGWTYRGKWEDGERHGQGVLSSTIGHRFSGEWVRHHLPHGTLTGRFLGTYVGHFKATARPEWPLNRHGKGKWNGLRGDEYEGQWQNDYYEGMGVLRTKFAVYEGRFLKGERHGHGVLVATNGDWYEGEFRHDVFDGHGERSDHAGVYNGEFKGGKRHGHGTFTTHQGVRYVGAWIDGLRHGRGEQSYPDGSSFIGQFANDKKVGEGEFVDGHKGTTGGAVAYYGSYEAGMRHGDGAEWEGVYGDKYRGSFQAGEMHGVGKFNWADGEEYLGCWLAPGGSGQMPRRMSAVKRHGFGGGKSSQGITGGLADNLQEHAERTRTMGVEASGKTAAERIPVSEMPNAVNALKGALLQGGLEMMGAPAAGAGERGGAKRAAGSLAQHKMGSRRATLSARADVRSKMASNAQNQSGDGVGNSVVSNRMMAVATSNKNPFAEAGVGVMAGGSSGAACGPRGHVQQSAPDSTRPAAMKSNDLSTRFEPRPPGTPSSPRGRVTGQTKAKKELDNWLSELG